MHRVEHISAWLTNYANTFLRDEPDYDINIHLKRDHSFRVFDEAQGIIRSLRGDTHTARIASVAALLHDCGRFEQYRDYGTFLDKASTNHGTLGVHVIENKQVLADYSPDEQERIKKSIRYHNIARLPTHEPEEILRTAQIVRDADKLDILNILTEYYLNPESKRNNILELGIPVGDKISSKICADIAEGKHVDTRDIRNISDYKIFLMSWVYDMNFAHTLRQTLARKYLDRLMQSLTDAAPAQKAFDALQRFIDQNS